MAAYATSRLELAPRPSPIQTSELNPSNEDAVAANLVDALINQLADRVAERLAAAVNLSPLLKPNGEDEWLDSRHAAEYLGVHRDTLRKLAAERAIPTEQDGPNCKLYFRRSDLDSWRRTGGRPRHLADTLRSVG
jgi:excisionase family DNA binding protein